MNEEMENAKKAISVLGGKYIGSEEFMLPDSDIFRNFVIIKKVKETPKKYPRDKNQPKTNPIK